MLSYCDDVTSCCFVIDVVAMVRAEQSTSITFAIFLSLEDRNQVTCSINNYYIYGHCLGANIYHDKQLT